MTPGLKCGVGIPIRAAYPSHLIFQAGEVRGSGKNQIPPNLAVLLLANSRTESCSEHSLGSATAARHLRTAATLPPCVPVACSGGVGRERRP